MKGLSLTSLALVLYDVGNEHILQRFLCLEVTLLNITASFFLHHWAITKFPSAPVCIWKAKSSTGTCARDSVWLAQKMPFKRFNDFFFLNCGRKLQFQPDSRAPGSEPAHYYYLPLSGKDVDNLGNPDVHKNWMQTSQLLNIVDWTKQNWSSAFPEVFNEVSDLALE